MDAYRFMSRLFPRSFTAKIFFIAFIGTHVPLLAMVALILGRGDSLVPNMDIVLPLLLATLGGTVGTLLGLLAMLRPLFRIETSLRALEEQGEIRPLPTEYRDVVGKLMVRVNRLALRIDERLGEAARRADTDALTGLLNRSGLRRHMPELARGAVLFIDIDHFKQVNDSYGHDVGDRLLVEFAITARKAMRKNDLLARMGGEEFVAFLPGADAETSVAVAERLRMSVADTLRAEDRKVTVSVGIAVAADAAQSVASLVTAADHAAYTAKQQGRNRVCLNHGAVGAMQPARPVQDMHQPLAISA
ncbi:GGDEF domain-containing protein [Halovulum dunhuangense]|uniref:diguanylate cyclase n=1 Tax=Halovulum dunhuangense TaxID=1505036 RepID=A0A849KYV7_9RHOB|nr:GGDEF domain-containing protein [Halovulum dunhuangense]NNU79526.1 GGDEF domain-containing protein [Halovulum dunhuangense]